MAEIEAKGQNPEVRIILIGSDNQAIELETPTDHSPAFLSGIRTVLSAAIDDGFLQANPFVMDHAATLQPALKQKSSETPLARSEYTLADLNSSKHFQDYFVSRLELFLGEKPTLPLPSQRYVDQGKRIKDAGFTTYQPVACPNLTITENYQYPENWKSPLDSWVYQQIANGNLQSDEILNLRQMYGWLDISPAPNWESGDPMFDPKTDKPLVGLLKTLRAKGARGGLEVADWCKHLNLGSLYGISADEARDAFYPALAKIFGADKGEVIRNLKAAEFNFIGNYLYFDSNGEIDLGGANSWIWLEEGFGVGRRLIAGSRGHGGLGRVRGFPSGLHGVSIRPRPLVIPPSAA